MYLNRINFFLALISGAIGTLSFSPYDFWPAALISLFLLQFMLLEKKLKNSACIGFLWGLGLFGSGINWIYVSISTFDGLSALINFFLVIFLIVYLSIYPMLFGVLLNYIFPSSSLLRLTLVAPALWHILEFLRSILLTGFPWLQFGYSQINGPLKWLAPIMGVEGITFFLMSIVGLLVYAYYYKRFNYFLVVIISCLFCFPLNIIKWYTFLPSRNINIAMIQGNIPQSIKWEKKQLFDTLYVYTMYSKPWMKKNTIIIWPECAITDLESNQQKFLKKLDHIMRIKGSVLITGIVDSRRKSDNHYYNYNSLIVLGDKNNPYSYLNHNRYQKNHLVPFGEFVPLEKWLRPLGAFFNVPMSSFIHGPYIQSSLKVLNYKITSSICYEIILGEKIRANFSPDTDFLLTLSNDAWFGHSIGPWQHFQMARMRALELGRPLLCSTNNGITAIVTADGNIKKILPPFMRQVLYSTVRLTKGITPYAKIGTWPVWFLTFISFFLALIQKYLRITRIIDNNARIL